VSLLTHVLHGLCFILLRWCRAREAAAVVPFEKPPREKE